jgi:SAM-dependent methyltransferase
MLERLTTDHGAGGPSGMDEPGKEALYGRRDRLGAFLSAQRTRAVLPFVREGTLVDLACGDNRLVTALGHAVRGVRGIGVDIRDYGSVDLVREDLADLPFADLSVDTVTILAALNYFDDPVSVLREARRILKEAGVLIVTLLDKRLSRIWHVFRDRSLPRIAFSENELRALLEKAGLRIAARHSFMLGLNRIYIIEKG